jgi:hypothetical protein
MPALGNLLPSLAQMGCRSPIRGLSRSRTEIPADSSFEGQGSREPRGGHHPLRLHAVPFPRSSARRVGSASYGFRGTRHERSVLRGALPSPPARSKRHPSAAPFPVSVSRSRALQCEFPAMNSAKARIRPSGQPRSQVTHVEHPPRIQPADNSPFALR